MRIFAVILSLPLLFSNISTVSGLSAQQSEPKTQVELWRQQMSQRGTGEKSKWEAQLVDGQKIRGYASEIQQDGFTLADEKTGESFDISYSQLKSLKPRVGMSKWAKAAIIGGAAFGALWAAFAITKPWDD